MTVHSGSTESITLAKDSTGRLWVTYTQVAPDNGAKVYVNHSSGGDAVWGTPYAISATSASVHYDDISTIVAYQNDKIGVMWSNQLARKFYLAVHKDGAADTSWQTEVANGGGVGGCSTGCANDHVNVKQLSSDGSGRLFAAVKTANRNTGQAFVSLLVRNQSGSWSSYPFGAVEDLHTRPMVLLDEEHREVFMFAVSPEVGGTIYYKKSGIDNISFPPGLGTPFLQSGIDTDISNPTTTKQNLNSATGLLVLESMAVSGDVLSTATVRPGPQGPTASPTASFAFSSADTGATFECSLDGSSFAGCAAPQQYAALTDGLHSFAVRARDAVGNADASPATRNWTVDTVAPHTSISVGPTGTVNSRTATLTFGADEAGSTFECRLDGAAYASCTSPKQDVGVADGAHSFAVRATDAAGNVDATPATRAWTVEPVVFRDGFQTGDFSHWTLPVRATGGGSVVVQLSVVKTKAFAARISAPASTDYAYVRKTLSASQTDLSVAGAFQITTQGATGQEVSIFKLYDSASTRLVYLNRRNVSGRIYAVYNGTTFPTTAKLALGTWANLKVRTITAGTTSTIDVTMDGVPIHGTATASLGTSGIRTLQIGNDKQLPFALYADNIEAILP